MIAVEWQRRQRKQMVHTNEHISLDGSTLISITDERCWSEFKPLLLWCAIDCCCWLYVEVFFSTPQNLKIKSIFFPSCCFNGCAASTRSNTERLLLKNFHWIQKSEFISLPIGTLAAVAAVLLEKPWTTRLHWISHTLCDSEPDIASGLLIRRYFCSGGQGYATTA